MQPKLPLGIQLAPGQVYAHGVLVDFKAGLLRPASVKSIGVLLSRVGRFGIQMNLRTEFNCSVLFHSYFTGRVAQALAASGEIDLEHELGDLKWTDDLMLDLLGLYSGFLHVGSIFGGDLLRVLPDWTSGPLKQYQGQCQWRTMSDLRLPILLPGAIHQVISLADAVASEAEMKLLPFIYARSTSSEVDHLMEMMRLDLDIDELIQPFFDDLLGDGRFPRSYRVKRSWTKMVTPKIALLSSHMRRVPRVDYLRSVESLPRLTKQNEGRRMTTIIEEHLGSFSGQIFDTTRMSTVGRADVWEVLNNSLIQDTENAA